jgi:ubiquinone/menaquinone biosynthesis C-methylase UbiE
MSIDEFCSKIYWSVQKKIVPELQYSQTIYEGLLFNSVLEDEIWLDLGCGHNLLSPWRTESEKKLIQIPKFIVGLDYDKCSLHKHISIKNLILGDISKLPFKDGSFSLITSNMVFEHLNDPLAQLIEIYRILKPGGRLIFHTPNLYGYLTIISMFIPKNLKIRIIFLLEKRKAEDVFPTYYRINTENAIRLFGQRVGFKINKIRMIVSIPQFWKIPPIAVIELLLIKLLMKPFCRNFRMNIIATLVKP